MSSTWPRYVGVGVGAALLAFVGVHAWRIQRSQALVEAAHPAEARPAQPRESWLVAGDSTAVGVGAGDSRDSVAGRLASAYPHLAITNVARSGAKFAEVAEQLRAVPGRFDTVLVQAGGNEAIGFAGMDAIEADLRRLLAHAAERGGRVVFMPAGNEGNAPMFSWPLSAWIRHRARALHALEVRVARDAGVTFVDLYKEGDADPFVQHPQRYFARDGLHPSSAGYGLWFTELVAAAPPAAR